MIPLRPPLPTEVAEPFSRVVEQAAQRMATLPRWIAVEDREGEWLSCVAAASACERRRSVVAVRSERALVQSVQIGIGGALWQPPSTMALVEAFAAAEAVCPMVAPVVDARLVDLVLMWGEPIWAIGWRNAAFWRRQLGEAALDALLVELARRMAVLAAIVPGPMLLVGGEIEGPRLLEIARDLAREYRTAPNQGLAVFRVGQASQHAEPIATRIDRAIAAGDLWHGSQELEVEPQPVFELPSGRLAGWWSPQPIAEPPRHGWLATPGSDPGIAGQTWRLRHTDGREEPGQDVLLAEHVATTGRGVVRLAGWASHRIRAGSPSGLLVGHLADAAKRVGARLWLPNVDHDAMDLILRLRETVWVDGPAVPKPAFGTG